MRSLTFSLATQPMSEKPLRDLERERGLFPAAVVIEGTQEFASHDYRSHGTISRVFGQRLH